ncbi:MAG: ribosome maturation factor RimM [Sphaerochaetaceae bacterium]
MDYLATGVLKRPHGVHGFIKIHLFSGESKHLKDSLGVSLRRGESEASLVIEKITTQGSEFLIKFKGLESPEAVRRYSGWEVWIARREAPKLLVDEFYVADLIGCSLLYGGQEVAVVEATVEGGQALLLEVRHNVRHTLHLIPFLGVFIGKVDIEGKTIELLKGELLE